MQAEQLCSVWVPLPHLYRGVEAVAFGETSELPGIFCQRDPNFWAKAIQG